METEAASLTEPSATPLLLLHMVAVDWTVKTDMLGEEGPSPPLDCIKWLLLLPLIRGFLEWHVAVDMAVASDIGIRHRPFPCKYCIAEPMSSSISFATWCSVTVKLSLVWDPPLVFRPPFDWIQSPPLPPPYKVNYRKEPLN